jgi:hypothetical protein
MKCAMPIQDLALDNAASGFWGELVLSLLGSRAELLSFLGPSAAFLLLILLAQPLGELSANGFGPATANFSQTRSRPPISGRAAAITVGSVRTIASESA